RPQDRHFQMPEAAAMLEALFRPGSEHDPFRLLEACLRLLMVEPVALVVVNIEGGAAAETNDEPPLAHMVDERELLGEADRVVERGLEDGVAQFAAPGRSGERGREGDGVDIDAVAVEMMLGQPQYLDAELVGEAGLAQRLLDDAPVIIRLAALGEQEI